MNTQTLQENEGDMSIVQNNALQAQDIQNILNIMSRVDLKGNEASAYVTCEMKLRVMLNQMEQQAKDSGGIKAPSKLAVEGSNHTEGGDGDADTTS